MKVITQRNLLCTTALISFLIIPSYAHAEPVGGVVTGGNAAIENAGNTTTINQTTNRAIIRWDSFDLNALEHVRFNQPNSSSITVNRIRDNKPSQINGRISANGNIVLMNPNGVVFGATSTVDVGSLVATTSDLEDDNAFLSGGAVKFTKPGNADAKIINNGTMTVREGGLVGLVGPNVENHGIIEARLGKAILASGDIATIDFAGDGLIKLQISDGVLSQTVLNTGTIKADGGSIILTAAQARGMVDALITNTGTLQANTVKVGNVERKGEILLSTKGIELNLNIPRAEGIVFNTGTIEAKGLEDTHNGGIITILGDTINIGDGSYVTASGGANGGTIKIGGEYQGGNGLPTSDKVFISEHVILNASSRKRGNGGTIILWSDDHTSFMGHADVSGGALGGDGGFIEVSGKNTLAFTGTVNLTSMDGKRGTLLLDPTDIVISNGADSNISGGSPFTPTIDNGPTVLNISTLLAALASGDVIVQTRATGAQTGNITVSNAIAWSSGSTLTLDAHNNIIVNAAITGNNLRFVVGNDLQLNADISGAGTLTIQQAADSGTVGIGASAVGTLNLNASDLSHIVDGWNEIIIGKITATAAMDVRATTWTDNLRLLTGTGVISINGAVNVGSNDLSIVTDGNLTINASGTLSGSGNLYISQSSVDTTIGLGGTGTINLTTTEIARILNGWSNITLGRTDGTGQINMAAVTWNDFLTIQSGTGLINVSGVQTMAANNLTFVTDGDITLGATNVLYGTGTLTFIQSSAGTTIGLGDGQLGAINLTNLEIARIRNGWGNIVIGRTDGIGDINVGALTWNDFLTIQTGAGVININGNQTMAANNLTLRTDSDINLVGNLIGTGTLTLTQSSDSTSIAIGDSQTGTLHFTNSDMAKLTDGWTTVIFGRNDGSADLNVGAYSFVDSITLLTGAGDININDSISVSGGAIFTSNSGALNIDNEVVTNGATSFTASSGPLNINANVSVGANALTLRTDSDILINGNLSGSGAFALVQASAGASMGLGSSQTGDVHLDDTEMDHILNGWSSRTFGRTDSVAALGVDSYNWVDALVLRTGAGQLTIEGANMNANNLTLQTDSNLAINGNLAGSTAISIIVSNAASSIGIGDSETGDVHISNAEFAMIVNGWADIVFGTTGQTGAMNIGTLTWNDRVNLRTGSGQMTINGAQNFTAQTVIISTNSDIAINAQLTGTGGLSVTGSSASATIGVGDGQGGMINLSNSEIDLMTNTFSSVTIGSTSHTGAITIGNTTWKDPLVVRTSGIITTAGILNMLANNLTFVTASDIVIGHAINTTGAVTFAGTSTSSTTIGVGTGQAGLVSISDDELALISNTVSSVIFGGTTMNAALNVAGRSWSYNTEFRTRSGAINFNGVQNAGTKNMIIRTNSNLSFSHNIVGSGTLTIMGTALTTTMGIGDGQTGTLNLTNAELAYIADGWSNIIFGRTDSTATINVGARTWNDSVDFRTLGTISINGAQNMGANNLVIRTNANPVIGAALNGTGDLTFRIISGNTSVGIGDGMTGTVNFTNAELNYISNGWNLISFIGGGSGVFNVGARTWNDNVYFNNSTGLMTLAAQTMGANNLSIRTSSALTINGNLSGTGTLTIDQNATNYSIGVGTGTGGTINLTDTELTRIVDGWSNIVIGRTDSTTALSVINRTWTDNVTFQTGSGTLTVNGATMGANNLTLITNSNIVIGGNLSGTGNLVLRTVSGATAIGVGDGQAGTFLLSNLELSRLVDGWSKVTIGSTDIAGNMNIGAYTWVNPMSFITGGNIVINGDHVSTETTGTSLVYATINGAFINNAGSDALNPGGGRYLVYSVDENNDTLGGIVRPGILADKPYADYGPALVVELGSQHLYSGIVNKILYLTIDDIDKIYGDDLPAFTYSYVSGLVNGDLLADVVASYTMNALGASVFDDAGVTRVITGNFNLNNGYSVVVTNGMMTVVKADLIVEADPSSRVYGDSNPIFTVSYSGFKNGEDETDLDNLANAATSATVLSDVGTYNIITSGGNDSNYNYIYQTGTLTVTKATLIATMQNTSRVYGDSNPAFTANYTGFKNGQNSSIIDILATGSSAGVAANVGTYAITGSGAFDNNYTFSYVNGTMTVTKATLVATANDASRYYGDSNPAFTVSYTGFKNGQDASVIDSHVVAASAADALSNAGTYNITTSGGLDNNYTFSYANGTLTVNKAVLTATAGNGTREYGEANPGLGVTYTGFKNGEDDSVIDTDAVASSAADATSNVGSYATTATGGFDNNYTFSYVNGTLTVTKAMLTATAGDGSRAYGDANPALGVTYTGFKNGEDHTVINTGATAIGAANALSDVGFYDTTASGAFDNNYDFTYVDGTLTVTKALLTATAGNASRAYGDANGTIGVTYTGFKNGQNSSVIGTLATGSSAADATSGVGLYTTTATGAFDDNYDFTYADGVMTVTKAVLTATAGNASREYGEANGAIGVTYTGFKNGEDDTVIGTYATASSAATALSNVGTYATTATGAFDDNYTFNYVNGTLAVTKATLLATAEDKTRTYGAAAPAYTFVYTGFKNGENASVINVGASGSTTATVASDTGLYTISGSGAFDNNYDFTYADGALTVTQAMLTVYANNASRKQGEVNPPLSVTYAGFRNGDNSSVLNTQAVASTTANVASAIGTYGITASGAADNNYTFTYVDGTLTVLDPDYVPPPPPQITLPTYLPSTVTGALNTPSAIGHNNIYFMPTVQGQTIINDPRLEHIVIIPDDDNFDYMWQQDHFLIAMTDTVQNYYNLVSWQEDYRR